MQHDPYSQNAVLHEIRAGRAMENTANSEVSNAKKAITNRLAKTGSGESGIESVVRLQIKPETTTATERQYASTATDQVARLAIPTSMLTRQESEVVQYPHLSEPTQQSQNVPQSILPTTAASSAVIEAPNNDTISLADTSYRAAEHEAFINAVGDSNNGLDRTVPIPQQPAIVAPEAPESGTDFHQERVNAVVRARLAVWDAIKDQPDQLALETRQQILNTHGSTDQSDYATAA